MLDKRKGADLIEPLLAALDSIGVHNVQIDVLGTGVLFDNLTNYSKRDNRIIVHGYVKDPQKKFIIGSSHAMIILSRTEEFGINGVESMALGVPVISLDLPGPKEYVRDNYNGFIVKDISEMAEKILKISRVLNNEYYKTLKINCFKTAEYFEINKIGKEVFIV